MNDELDTLSDSALDEVFAVMFTDWKQVELMRGDKARGIVARFQRPEVRNLGQQPYTPMHTRFKDGGFGGDPLPAFSTDANAVLSWMEKHGWIATNTDTDPKGPVSVKIDYCEGKAPTFARAACIALIRAKRADSPLPNSAAE